jgi:hypothetical protein
VREPKSALDLKADMQPILGTVGDDKEPVTAVVMHLRVADRVSKIGLSTRLGTVPSPGARALMAGLRNVVHGSSDFRD